MSTLLKHQLASIQRMIHAMDTTDVDNEIKSNICKASRLIELALYDVKKAEIFEEYLK